MYVFLSLLIMLIIINCLCTIVLPSSSNNRILRNLKHIVNTALEKETSDDINNEFLIEQLSQILEQEDGFRIIDRKQRSLFDETEIFDGSGDIIEDEYLPPFYSNMSIITFTMVRDISYLKLINHLGTRCLRPSGNFPVIVFWTNNRCFLSGLFLANFFHCQPVTKKITIYFSLSCEQ